MPRVVVVGGGIAGLSAARALAAAGGVEVVVLEATAFLGGKLRVSEVAGVPVDEGAEQVLTRVPEAIGLVDELGLGGELRYPRTLEASVWSRGALRQLPAATILGVPADPVALARSGVLGIPGLLRAGGDLFRPRTRIEGDVAVGAYVGARAGRALVDRLVDPLLGGVYAGRADRLSLAATVPQLFPHVARHRTLLGAARAARAATAPDAGSTQSPVFATVVGGLGRLPDALTASAGTVRTRAVVRTLTRTADGFRLEIGDTRAPEPVDAAAVVVAVPAAPATRLLATVAPAAAAVVGTIETASVAIVTLAYARATFPAVHGSGFLVPAVERRTVKAVTFVSNKWEHAEATEVVLVRASVGRHGDERDLQRDDADLVAAVDADLRRMIGLNTGPVDWRVSRWGGALPQYAVGHLDRVATIRRALPSGVAVCGAAYDGVGVPACIRSGRAAADAVLSALRIT